MIILRWVQKVAALVACLSMLTGCGGDRPRTYAVTLPVSINGQAAAGANVTLHPQGAEWAGKLQQRPFGIVGEDGTVRFSTFKPNDGVPAGDYVVSVIWPRDGAKGHDAMAGEHQNPERANPLTLSVKTSGTLPELAIQSQSLIRSK